jgi:glycosyltransferase involved in cell wall biosynthesis
MIKLAILHPFLIYKGGAERVVLKIAEHYDAKVYVVDYKPEATFEEFKKVDIEKIKAPFLPIPKRMAYGIASGFAYFNLKLKDYDVVNAQGVPSEWARNKNKPMVWYCHTPNREAYDLYEWRQSRRSLPQRIAFSFLVNIFKQVEKRIVPKIEYIFANSKLTKERIKKYLNREAEVLYPGVDYKEFYLKEYGDFFFYPSRITPEKRMELAIEAFKEFEKYDKNFKLVIAGSLAYERKEHVEYFKFLKRIIGNDERIKLLTNISEEEMKQLYARCYCVVFTPINEDFGLIPLEANASYKPIIAANEGGPRETIKNNFNGFLINNKKELVEKMLEVSKNEQLTKKLGKNGRKFVEKNFSWERFFKVFDKRINEITKSF